MQQRWKVRCATWSPVVLIACAVDFLSSLYLGSHPFPSGPPEEKAAALFEILGEAAVGQARVAVVGGVVLIMLRLTGRLKRTRQAVQRAAWSILLANVSFFALLLFAFLGIRASI